MEMLRQGMLFILTLVVFGALTVPAQAWGVTCPDPSIPGTWTVMYQCKRSCDFGIILYSEAVTVFLPEETVCVTNYPDSWDFFYGDFFIMEDWWGMFIEEDEMIAF